MSTPRAYRFREQVARKRRANKRGNGARQSLHRLTQAWKEKDRKGRDG